VVRPKAKPGGVPGGRNPTRLLAALEVTLPLRGRDKHHRRYSRFACRSAIFIADFASSRPVQTLANMSSTMKSASAAAAF